MLLTTDFYQCNVNCQPQKTTPIKLRNDIEWGKLGERTKRKIKIYNKAGAIIICVLYCTYIPVRSAFFFENSFILLGFRRRRGKFSVSFELNKASTAGKKM